MTEGFPLRHPFIPSTTGAGKRMEPLYLMEGKLTLTPHSLHPNCFPPPNPFSYVHHRQLSSSSSSSKLHVSSKTPTTKTRNPRRRPIYRIHKRRHPMPKKDASPLSLPLHSRNPQAIYDDIQRFARQDKLKEALTIMDYLDQQGIPVNPTTFSALIASCIRAKSLSDAKQIHVHLRINGLENNEFLRTKLVQMYTSCGSREDAQKLFDEGSCGSVYSWNALIRGTVVSGGKMCRDVLNAYTEMRARGVELNVYTFANVIKSFAGASALRQGLKIHALLVKDGFVGSSMLKTCLIDMYFKCGKIRLAHKVFEEVPDRDIVLWGAMIAGFAHNRRQWEALDYVRWMVREGVYPNSVILTTILPVIGEIWARRLGQEVHGYVLKTKDYLTQLTVQSGLIDMYCKCGEMGSGRRVFYSSVERNVVSWTALISGYVSNGRLDQALRSVVWMQQEGFKPDVVTIATVVPVCRELRALKHGKEVHAYAIKNLFLPNASITTSLIKMYSECGVLDYSVRLFDNMNRNLLSWTAMIDSYVKSGRVSDALCVFRSMLLSKHRPDSVVTARMLSICSEIKALKLGKEMHARAFKNGFESIPFVSAEIIKLYGSCGLIHCARSAFNVISVKGSMTWTAIIEAYGFNNLWKGAMDLFHEMISRGFTPTHFTFDVVLAICEQAGFTDEACQTLRLMSQTYNIKVSEEHYSILIRLLTRSGRIEEARELMQMSYSLS